MFKKSVLTMAVAVILILAARNEANSANIKRYGRPIPKDTPGVKLAEVIKNTPDYKDKEIVLEGIFAGICCAGGYFYKEGFDTIEFYPRGFSLPGLAMGTRIRIYGIAESSRAGISLETKGLEVLK